ncbi:MAG: hypothetical protein H0W93_03485 [Gammaproteobacteria bacterium]|nr:hypothetical protein [Gammaproteobacteria bacterium]
MCCAGLCSLAPRVAFADDYLAELRSRADAFDLARHRQWRLLLHYEPGLFAGVTSTADSNNFFLALNGKTRPRAELKATLRAFFGRRRAPAFSIPNADSSPATTG